MTDPGSNRPEGRRPRTPPPYELLGAGLEFLAAVVACTAIGYGADWLLGLPAVGTILGAFAGFAAGLYRLVKTTAPRP